MIRAAIYMVLGAMILLLWQDPDNFVSNLEDTYGHIKHAVVGAIRWASSGG